MTTGDTKTWLQWRSQSFTAGRAQSGPLTALIGYLNVLLEYFDFSNFHWQGTNNIWVGLGPAWPALGYAPAWLYPDAAMILGVKWLLCARQ